MVAEEGNKKFRAAVLKDKPQITVAAAFEELAAQFADTETAMDMRLTKTIDQVAKRKQALYLFVLWQPLQPADHRRVDGKQLTQAAFEAPLRWLFAASYRVSSAGSAARWLLLK